LQSARSMQRMPGFRNMLVTMARQRFRKR